jgi:phage terminase large subunit GpA-like protein
MGKPYPGPWSFEHHPWLREMHDDMSEFVVGQKAAQMGYTEWVLNITFYCIDVLAESVLYVLPSESDANDFSASRFDPALELSPHLGAIFSDVRNVALKRAGSASLYTRGSRSRSKLKSLPVGVLIFDEIDEMIQANIPLAMERTSGQVTKMYRMLSTPTIDNYGINE